GGGGPECLGGISHGRQSDFHGRRLQESGWLEGSRAIAKAGRSAAPVAGRGPDRPAWPISLKPRHGFWWMPASTAASPPAPRPSDQIPTQMVTGRVNSAFRGVGSVVRRTLNRRFRIRTALLFAFHGPASRAAARTTHRCAAFFGPALGGYTQGCARMSISFADYPE